MSAAEVAPPPASDASTSSNAARARARRRRILENSASRLTRITGRLHEPISTEPDDLFPTDTTVAENCCPIDGAIFPTDLVDDASVFHVNHVELNDLKSFNISSFPPHVQEPERIVDAAKKEFSFLDTRLHIPLICILVQAMYISNRVTEAYLFFPLFIWEVIEFFYFENSQEKSTLDLLLPLIGLPPDKLSIILKLAKKLSHVLEDVFLYTFTTVVIQFVSSLLGIYR
ncbi:uncharacterized protein LOC143920922 [Arctopsyche grandis]|uniref:uncharacterized protein LOC143920922 n=1 Tax=Arctopsyche grandis TaxID=121162 RepID=UPI00406DA216